jgi:acetyl esterase/lipase
MGNRFTLDNALEFVKELDVGLVSVEFRLPPEYPHSAPLEDCYAGLK